MKRLLSFLLALILTLGVGMTAVNAQLSENGYAILHNHVDELGDDDTLAVDLVYDLPFQLIPQISEVMEEVSKRTDLDPGCYPDSFLTVDEAREYGAIYRAVKIEMIRANVLAAMDLLGLTFDEAADLGYSDDTVGLLGMPRTWRVTKAKLLQLADRDEVTAVYYDPNHQPIDYSQRLPQEPAPKTPEEKLDGTLKARLSWLDDGEKVTVIPYIPQLPYEVLYAAIAAKYGESVALDASLKEHKYAVNEVYAAYYAHAFPALREELGYTAEDVTVINDNGCFAVYADRDEIMRIAACGHVDSIEIQQSGFYVEQGCEKYVDTSNPLFRRFMAWGDDVWGNEESGVGYGGYAVCGFNELFSQRDEEGAIQWSILEARIGCPPPWEVKCGGTIADRFIYSIGGYDVFMSGYALYDADTDEFYALESVNDADYPGLREALWTLQLGNPVGDADLDGSITILDATRIQRVLADLDYLEEIGNVSCGQCKHPFADMDGDGKITILDATGIQRTLVGLPIGE